MGLWVVVTFVGWDWGWVGGGGGGTRIFGEQGGDDGVDSVGVDGGVRGEVERGEVRRQRKFLSRSSIGAAHFWA